MYESQLPLFTQILQNIGHDVLVSVIMVVTITSGIVVALIGIGYAWRKFTTPSITGISPGDFIDNYDFSFLGGGSMSDIGYRIKRSYRGDVWVRGMPVLRKRGHQRGITEGVFKTQL